MTAATVAAASAIALCGLTGLQPSHCSLTPFSPPLSLFSIFSSLAEWFLNNQDHWGDISKALAAHPTFPIQTTPGA